jgi:DNA-binding NarL/FixJ family response regulator
MTGKDGGDGVIRVFAVDDHEMFRRGLEMVFEKTSDIRMVGEAGRREHALRQLDPGKHDVVLLDISLPGDDGLTILKEFKARFPSLPVLMVSAHPEEHYGVAALRSGASGYVCKDSGVEPLMAAIRKARQGRIWLSDAMAEILAVGADRHSGAPETLSERELQVLRRLAAGEGNKQIAAGIGISTKTVSTYKTRVMQKTGRKTTAELIRYAFDNSLVE